MDSAALRPADLLTADEARRIGLTRQHLGRKYRRVARGLYVPVGVPVGDVDAQLVILARRLAPGVVLGGWSAARLHEQAASPEDDLRVFDGVLPAMDRVARVPLPAVACSAPGRRVRPTPHLEHLRSDLRPDEVTSVAGIPVTEVTRTAFDLARRWPVDASVVALDRLRYLGVLDVRALEGFLAERRGWRGVGRAREALTLSQDGVESPRESMVRLLWLGASLARPLSNATVLDHRGSFLARVDLLDPAVGLVVEYDGATHASAPQRARDAARQERLEEAGMIVVRINEPDLADGAARELSKARLRLAHRRAAASERPQRWTLRT